SQAKAYFNYQNYVDAVVQIYCWTVYADGTEEAAQGSGTFIDDEGLILTNGHVIEASDGLPHDFCIAGNSTLAYLPPDYAYGLDLLGYRYDDEFDYAFMQARYVGTDETATNTPFIPTGDGDNLILGDEINILGYPAIGQDTITFSRGYVSGYIGTTWIKTDAFIEAGSSGGTAMDANGFLIGVPTAASIGDISSLAYIQNINAIAEDILGDEFSRDYSSLYQRDPLNTLDPDKEKEKSDDENDGNGFHTERNIDFSTEVTEIALDCASLIKSSDNSAVYCLKSDNRRYVFPTEDIYYSWYSDFSSVETVSPLELASYMIGGNIKWRSGYLVKIPSVDKVYLVTDGGMLRWVTSEEVANDLFENDWADYIYDLPEAFFIDYSVGQAIF
ncbi:serine protease, partial [Patescibacteria group bacterium]|nr:serine protease [Patescibacteria group bacterium]MBU1922096.1 serine protease [Patescibacteria group bacterium]